MNILIPDSWLREYLETPAIPSQIKECLSLCGPSVEKVEKVDDDYIYHIEITSNRVDMAGVYGIAREAAAILPRFGIKARLVIPDLTGYRTVPVLIRNPNGILNPSADGQDDKKSELPLTINDPQQLCERLLGIVMNNVKIGP